jgi:hypothetical protein
LGDIKSLHKFNTRYSLFFICHYSTFTLRLLILHHGWTAVAATAFTAEGFDDISDIGLVTRDFLHQVCKKLRAGRPTAAAADGNPAVPAIPLVNIPAVQEFKLYGLHLWVTEKVHLKRAIIPGDFTAAVGMAYPTRVREIIEVSSKKYDENVKQPEPFGGKRSEWQSFYKLYHARLRDYRGIV